MLTNFFPISARSVESYGTTSWTWNTSAV